MTHVEPWAGATYVAAGTRDDAALSPNLIGAIGGVAIALALGLAVGVASQFIPKHEAAEAPRAEMLNVEVAKPVILPAPKPVSRLEVLPGDMARNARHAVAVSRPDPRPIEDQRALDTRRFEDEPEMALPADETPDPGY